MKHELNSQSQVFVSTQRLEFFNFIVVKSNTWSKEVIDHKQ